jgi:hypothetical protein
MGDVMGIPAVVVVALAGWLIYLLVRKPSVSPTQRALERAYGIARCAVCDEPITPGERELGRNSELCAKHRVE